MKKGDQTRIYGSNNYTVVELYSDKNYTQVAEISEAPNNTIGVLKFERVRNDTRYTTVKNDTHIYVTYTIDDGMYLSIAQVIPKIEQ